MACADVTGQGEMRKRKQINETTGKLLDRPLRCDSVWLCGGKVISFNQYTDTVVHMQPLQAWRPNRR